MNIKKIIKSLTLILLTSVSVNNAKAQSTPEGKYITVYQGVNLLKASYPDVNFEIKYDHKEADYIVTVSIEKKAPREFYWCGGAMLPEAELKNKENYWSLFYLYSKELEDPANYTDEQKEALMQYGSKESRRNGVSSPMFFFDYIYSGEKQSSIEPLIKSITFLGKRTRVHEKVLPALRRVETRITELAKTDEEVKTFVSKIKSADAYHWRLIDGTNRKSFHSLGIAQDFIPTRITGEIFWSWARDKNPSGWAITPISKRWVPPTKVIQIYEEEGFIWGGKWALWDNMHFEYHPEILNYNFHPEIMYQTDFEQFFEHGRELF